MYKELLDRQFRSLSAVLRENVSFGPSRISAIDCCRCGGRADLIRRTPHPKDISSELRIFECSDCGSEIEISVAE